MVTDKGVIVPCRKCHMKVAVTELRADRGGSGWICYNCYQKQHNILEEAEKPRVPVTRKEIADPDFINHSYWCSACGHKFRSNMKFDANRLCPNCGESGYIEKEKSSKRILKESDLTWVE